MKNLSLSIITKNAAFDDNCGAVVADILRGLADHVERGDFWDGMKLLDSNGNTVGKVNFSKLTGQVLQLYQLKLKALKTARLRAAVDR